MSEKEEEPGLAGMSGGIPIADTPEGKLWAIIERGECPACGSKAGFREGPRGGLAVNIFCEAVGCGAAYNVVPRIGIAERLPTHHVGGRMQ